MANILDVVQTIQNIVGQKGYDGALDEEGNPVKIGLKREVENTVTDSRLVDGFGVRFQGDKMILSYSSECNIKQVQKPNFQDMVEQNIADIISFIQKDLIMVYKISRFVKITSTIFFNTFYIVPPTKYIVMYYNCISWLYVCITNYRG